MTHRSGRCNRCRRHYSDLLDHIKKKHRQDKFTAEDVADTQLLIPLHGLYTSPLAIPSRPQVIIPQFGTEVIVIPQLSPTDTDTKANHSPPVILPSVDRTVLPEHLGSDVYAGGGMDLDPVEEESGDGDTESDTAFTESATTTSPTSPPSTPPPILPPSQPDTPAGRLLLAQLTLRSPAPPTLSASPILPLTALTVGPSSSGSTTTEPTAGQDVRDQPFMDKFRLLEGLDNGEVILDGAKRKPMDAFQGHPRRHPTHQPGADEETAHHLPPRASIRPLPAFWPQATHQLWIHTRYKEAVLEELNRFNVVQPGRFNYQATLGHSHVPTAVFIHCLDAAGCDTIRLKAYGQKMPMLDEFMQTEPADVEHRWAEHNEWDIGTSFDSPYIWLFASATGIRHGITHYPIIVPGSRDYGTVNLKVKHQARHFSVKIYPRLIHVIKSFNSHLQGGIPKTLRGVRTQVAAALRMIHSLTGQDAMALGGFRIEVTVKAPSLAEATRLVRRTKFMDPRYWLALGEGPHSKHRLRAKVVGRKAFLDNANWIYQQAQLSRIF
ncbi:hypothetical protein DB88DRAFT_513931 [Papiliotrema laurentii]|uniref:Uncharacterized protein n=1 Tax=Papiliotrema laurentii TaxID=5418 RepID=A0AAD9CWW2_PAPLA|nr:hypothetical protein DB88DRAFT_513931 [Papiliotrema laurentii]